MALQEYLRVRAGDQDRAEGRAAAGTAADLPAEHVGREGTKVRLHRLRQGVRGPQVAVASPQVRVREREAEVRVRGLPLHEPS